MSNDVYDGFKIVPKAFDSVESTQQKKVNIRLTQLMEKITIDHTSYIHDYHSTFDVLFRASERIRHQQKFQFQEQAKIAQEAHEDELAEYKNCHIDEDIPIKNTIEFVPKDMEISNTIEPYMRLAMETGVPLIELIPPTILAESLHYLSGSSTDTGSGSSQYYSSSSASIGHSSATSDTL